MKQKLSHLSLIALVAAAYFVLSGLSSATLINITINPTTGLPSNDINFGLLGNNNPTTNFNFLSSDVDLYNSYAGTSLAAPVIGGFANYENLNGSNQAVSLAGFDYAVVHYGKGPGGAGQGGGIVFYFLDGMTGNFSFAANGSGPNGFGGISSIRLFAGESNSVPDHGATLALLGGALVLLEVLRRSLAGKHLPSSA
jgi:hypothetical protein